MLKNCQALRSDPVNVFREANKTDLVNLAPFNLLHTISHCLIANIERHSGYEEKELSEYLLPMRLSILLYVTSVRNYNSGGLRLLFENYLSRWLDDASNFALNCLFDPICADRGNTCSGCVQQVIGCETFNQGLSRAYLHGGGVKFDDQSEIEQQITGGFWS